MQAAGGVLLNNKPQPCRLRWPNFPAWFGGFPKVALGSIDRKLS
jgi:hypothetical protein